MQLTKENSEQIENEVAKASKRYYKQADKIADSNDEIEGEWWEDWATRKAIEEVCGSEDKYYELCGRDGGARKPAPLWGGRWDTKHGS